MSIDILSGLVTTGAGVPGICTRHGEPAALRKPVRFISKPPGWTFALLLAGAVPFVIAVLVLRKEVRSAAWPFCARCRQMHKQRTLIGVGLLLPLVLLFVLAYATPDLAGPGVVVFGFAAVIAFIFGIGALARGSYRLLPQGVVARDGNTVGFAKAHPAFAAQARAAYEQAAQQHAAQQYAAWHASQQQAQAQPRA